MKNSSIALWSITVALAGFLFGFDTIVISGANEPIRELWQTSAFFHGTFIMSMALWGTVIGALFGGIPTDIWGRKKTLFWIGILYLVSAIGSALAPDPYLFSFFRFIGGVGVGASTVAAPIYISEISSAKDRGKLVALYQFMIVFGIFVAFFSNYFLDGVGGNNDWRWMLGVEAIPALFYSIMILTVPNSPRWLTMKKGDDNAAKAVLAKMDLETDVDTALNDLKNYFNSTPKGNIFSGLYNKQILLAFFIAFFNQLSGINFILYYAPQLLSQAGLTTEDSLLSSVSIGAVNLVFTFVGLYLIDRLGRKQLMYIGSIGYIISMAMVAYCFKFDASPMLTLTFILVFIASHAVGQGAVIWVFISEIFPNEVRSLGQSLGTGTHWVFAAIITLLVPVFIDDKEGIFGIERFGEKPWPVFVFFAGMMVLQLIWVAFFMPETKGKSLEDLKEDFMVDANNQNPESEVKMESRV
ncbi:MAG: sugar porter family MFS transporter [Bacteroidia bacterium]|nr:sugar porter family MFS transporter [Bacteroidia bacterium]